MASKVNGEKLDLNSSWFVLFEYKNLAPGFNGASLAYLAAMSDAQVESPNPIQIHLDGIDPVDASGQPTTPRTYAPGEEHYPTGRDAAGIGAIKAIWAKCAAGVGYVRWQIDGV